MVSEVQSECSRQSAVLLLAQTSPTSRPTDFVRSSRKPDVDRLGTYVQNASVRDQVAMPYGLQDPYKPQEVRIKCRFWILPRCTDMRQRSEVVDLVRSHICDY
jgi:hypothetical protein